ncbi:MAG: Uma2 family endonuclease [Selenomonadaceae bacterium]|nr:Uma2 family endonuclease [Selenomonadaceae bacterium]
MRSSLAYIENYEEAYELINGEEVMMSAASLPHLKVQGKLFNTIFNFLRGKKCEVFFEAKVVLDDKNWLQPDIVVVCDKNKQKHTYIDGAPDFVAEIISPTTQFRDIGVKKDLYEKFGVKEYWIIDPIAKNVIVYVLVDGKFALKSVHHKFSEEEWEGLDERQKARQELTLKLSLYDDLEIGVDDIFE